MKNGRLDPLCAVKQDKALDPIDIGLFGADAIMFDP